jgi:hypothetical protein
MFEDRRPTHERLTGQVLFRLKPGVTAAQISTWKETCQGMVGKIPGEQL